MKKIKSVLWIKKSRLWGELNSYEQITLISELLTSKPYKPNYLVPSDDGGYTFYKLYTKSIKYEIVHDTPTHALITIFEWSKSQLGCKYWESIYDRLVRERSKITDKEDSK